MVLLGGVTRLRRSGLSMTDWKFTGSLPRLSEEEWLREFDKYKQSPENKHIRSFQQENAESYVDARSQDILDEQDRLTDEVIGNENNGRASFLAKVAIVLGIAVTATIISICLKWPVLGSSLGIQFLVEGSSSSVMATPPVGFTFKVFGYNVVLPKYAPGYAH
uniref:Uncharacterized protein n=1 Tax=Quercus lobata TaxID=97700 RepID=A0A7N2QZY6_QUELO